MADNDVTAVFAAAFDTMDKNNQLLATFATLALVTVEDPSPDNLEALRDASRMVIALAERTNAQMLALGALSQ